jgi:hypothetical protein
MTRVLLAKQWILINPKPHLRDSSYDQMRPRLLDQAEWPGSRFCWSGSQASLLICSNKGSSPFFQCRWLIVPGRMVDTRRPLL